MVHLDGLLNVKTVFFRFVHHYVILERIQVAPKGLHTLGYKQVLQGNVQSETDHFKSNIKQLVLI